jgi:nucleoside-diphosphate-sugar epimerase
MSRKDRVSCSLSKFHVEDGMDERTDRRILVTGGTGMIGANLVHRLVKDGYDVSVLVRPSSSLLRLQPVSGRIRVLEGDLGNAEQTKDIVSQAVPQVVFHLASTPFNPPTIPTAAHLQVNVFGIANLLEAIRVSPETKIIFAGSANVYGEGEHVPESHALVPGNMLGATKACATILMQTYSRLYGIPSVELRLYTPYGPWERPGRLIPHTILSALGGQTIRMTSGAQERDYLFIEDVIEAMLLAMRKPLPAGAVVNICSGTGIPIREIVQRVLWLMGDPVEVQLGAMPTRPDEIWKFSGDNANARALLDWQPRTSLDDGLRKTIAWFRENRELAAQLT